ncbi:uncharacterized protein [Primulina huaijiensis]|uniref:uncharacterized protein n=1 Tax=Primulina huaijiensis TaxID=1492673 RepID=UPI003CC6FB21
MEEDMEMPLILGRPFLATGKALIDVKEGKLRLSVDEEEITFDVFNALKHTLHTDDCFRIDDVDSLVCNFVQDAMKDPLEATLTTELKEDDLDEEKYEIVAYFNANHPWRSPMRMRLEDLGEQRDLTPQKSSIEEPPTLELKPLHPHLKYVYLGENNTLPVIISTALIDVMEDKLFEVLKAHKSAFAWKVADIKGINPSVCMHKILMEDKYSPLVQPQRRLNPKMQEVVKAETSKLLDAGIIYPISDSAWNLKVVLMRCEETNLVLNWEKFHFMVQEGIVLGHKISGHRIVVDKAKVEVIKNLPPPTSIKGAYEDLKERFVTALVLVAPDWDLPFEVMCDASDTAVGAVLGQRQNKLFEVKHCPWYANFANFIVTGTPPPNLSFHQQEEFGQILNHCHDCEVGGHFGPTKTTSKVLECGFYWPTLFKDARSYVLACDKCQQTGEQCLLQLDQLEEFRNLAYDLALSYKEKTKRAHDRRIVEKEFKEGENVLLYNSRLRLFSGKLKSRWSGPFVISKVYPSGAVELQVGKDGTFTINAQRLKHYMGGTVEPQLGINCQSQAAVAPVVREFYANAVERSDSKAFVRGKLVDFSSVEINRVLETPAVDDSVYVAWAEEKYLIIHSQIQLSIQNPNVTLFFPHIIIELCAGIEVVFQDDDEWLPPTKALDDASRLQKMAVRRKAFPQFGPIWEA